MTRGNPPSLAVWKFASCDGCQLTVLDCEDELLTLAQQVRIATFAEASSAMTGGPYDVSLVEGSITTPHDERRIRWRGARRDPRIGEQDVVRIDLQRFAANKDRPATVAELPLHRARDVHKHSEERRITVRCGGGLPADQLVHALLPGLPFQELVGGHQLLLMHEGHRTTPATS